MPDSEPLVNVSAMEILIAMAPLALIACLSNIMKLDIGSPIVVSTIRTFVQLYVVSFILDPIFSRGVDQWWLVVGYCFLMILLASYEGSTRSKYYVDGQFWMVFFPMFINVVAVALFAFFVVIKPSPRWGRFFRRIYCLVLYINNNNNNNQYDDQFARYEYLVILHETYYISAFSAFLYYIVCDSQILSMSYQ